MIFNRIPSRHLLPLPSWTQPSSDADICATTTFGPPSTSSRQPVDVYTTYTRRQGRLVVRRSRPSARTSECMEALGRDRRRLGRRFQWTCSRSDRRPFRAACKSTTSRLLHETQFTYIRQQLDGNPRRQWSTINELLQASA